MIKTGRAARRGVALVLLALGACGTNEEPATPPRPEAAPPDAAVVVGPPPALPAPPQPAERDLCGVLAAILTTDAEGFAGLRASPVATGRWLGRAVVPGTERCTIEGEAWPQARYVCAGQPFQLADREAAAATFAALASEIDQCLSSPIWFPRSWQRGEPFAFALGERLQTWTDRSTAPPVQIVLKLQQDLDRSGYALQFSAETVP